LKSNVFDAIEPYGSNTGILSGTESTKGIQDLVLYLASSVFIKQGVLPLQCETYQFDNRSPSLLFNTDALDSIKSKLRLKIKLNLFAANHTLWSKTNGLSRVWGGVTYSDDVPFIEGTLIENNVSNSTKRITKSIDNATSTLGQPGVVVFLTNDTHGGLPLVSKLTATQASYHFLVGYSEGKFQAGFSKPLNAKPIQMSEQFETLLNESKATAYLINVGYKQDGKILPDEILEQVISSVLSGAADKASTKKDVAFTSLVVTELPNVQKELLSNYNTNASKIVADLFKKKLETYVELKPQNLLS